jgi:hypothetical protein
MPSKKQAMVDSFKVEIAGALALVEVIDGGARARVTVHEATESEAIALSRIAWEGRPLFPSSQFMGERDLFVCRSQDDAERYLVNFHAVTARPV